MADRRLRTLVVDDNQDFLRTCLRWLAGEDGIDVVENTGSGEAAVETVARLRPDLVLMDLAMPGIGGLEATRLIKSAPEAPLVVIMSIWDSQVARAEAGMVGADGYLAKPQLTTHLLPLLQTLAAPRPGASGGGAAAARHAVAHPEP